MSPKPLLVVNPNSSQIITNAIQRQIQNFGINNCEFLTGPPESPASIDDEESALQSCYACLPLVLDIMAKYAGFLVACYSDHPLVERLKEYTSKPVIGIMEASIIQALLIAGKEAKFGIVTTGRQWEPLLEKGALKFLGIRDATHGCSRFAGVASSGLGVLDLHKKGKEEVEQCIGVAARDLVVVHKARVICLGCAGMAGMESIVVNAVKDLDVSPVIVVDGVIAGVLFLRALAQLSEDV